VAEEGICEKRGRRERRILMRLKKLSAAMLAMTMAAGMMAVPAMAEEEEKQIEPCTVVFWHAMNGQQQDTLTALTEQFNEENEYGITVELVNQGYYSDLSTKLTASAVADTLPDLAQAYNNWLTPYLDKVIPLDDFIEDDFDDYEDIIESYRNECSAFGFVSSLPFNKSTYVYFYNKTMFDELGLEAPETWEDLVTIGETVMEEKGIASLGVDDLAGFLEASLFQNEGAYVTEDGPQFDTEEGLETVTYIMDLYNNGYARLVGEDGYFSTTISNQLVAAYIGSSTGVSYIDTTSGWELGVAPLPGNKTNAANQAGTNIVMFATDENQQLATWECMKFLTSTEATVQWAMETGYLPVRTSGYESEEYQTFMEDDLASTAAYAQADAFFSSEAFDGSYDVMSTVNTKLEELILDEADAETAYEELLEAIREAMDLEEEEDKFF
jgi:multiple sugar transport system substrate-binding protein